MAHSFIVPPQNTLKDTEFLNLPVYSTEAIERKSFHLRGLFQYLTVSPHTGFTRDIPPRIKQFFRKTPQHPAYGMGYAHVKIGDIVAWPKPELEIGNYFKVWKHPTPPVYEEAIRNMFYLQSGIQLSNYQWYDKYINGRVISELTSLIPGMTKAAIVNTLKDIFSIFWINFGMEKPILTDPDIVQRLQTVDPKSEALKYYLSPRAKLEATDDRDENKVKADEAKAKGRCPEPYWGIYGKYREAGKEIEKAPHEFGMGSYFWIVQKEAKEAIKNIIYYSPEYESLWMSKADTEVEMKKVAKPNYTDFKSLLKTVYLKDKQGKKVKPNTRYQSIATLIKIIRRGVMELTDASTPTRRNWIKYNPATGKGEPKYKYTFYNKEGRIETVVNNLLQKKKDDGTYEEKPADIQYTCFARPEDLVVCVSTWDYNDLMDGTFVTGQVGVETTRLTLPDGVTVLPMREFRPGQVYIGDKHVLNFFMMLDDLASMEHPTYLERSWITNFIMAFGSFQFLAGKMWFPGENYNAGTAFYNWAINEAGGLD